MAGQEELPFRWIGGRLCLDFNNTIDWIGLEPSVDERLGTYEDLIAWGTASEALPEETGRLLRRLAGERPKLAAKALVRALELRATIHGLFFTVASGEEADSEALTA
jgi:hypothetical protein